MPSASFLALQAFFESSPAARAATRPLGPGAEVALRLDGDEEAHFTMASGRPEIVAGPARAPDFTLRLPEQAVRRITAIQGDDVGAHGVAFFSLAVSKDPLLKIRVQIATPTGRLLGHGYLGVLAAGGLKVGLWLLRKGIKDPRAAIDRLRGVR